MFLENDQSAHNDFTLKLKSEKTKKKLKTRVNSVKDHKGFGSKKALADRFKDVRKVESACGNYIYHISIIDYLQKYDTSKKAERLSKMFLMGCKNGNELSSINPLKYKKRFLDFQKKVVFGNIK